MSKPVDLIVANELHRVAEAIERMPEPLRTSILADQTLYPTMARGLLCNIAHDARIEVVERLLEAVGVCGGLDGLAQRFSAVRDARAAEGDAATPQQAAAPSAPSPSPSEVAAVAETIADSLKQAFPGAVVVGPLPAAAKDE